MKKLLTHTSRFLRLSALLLVTAVLVAGAAGCGKKKAKAEVGIGNFPDGVSVADGMGAWGDGAWGDGTGLEGHAAGNGVPERLGGEKVYEGKAVPELGTVYFALDSDELDAAARSQLTRNAGYLRNNPELHVVLRGHCDERGTEEYNMSLGSRRALSVREHLVTSGIEADRLNTVSFGKSLPASDGTDEAALAQNRRVEFFVYTLDD